MKDYRVIPYEAAHYLEAVRGVRLVVDPHVAARAYAETDGVAYTGLVDGAVAVVAGIVIVSPGVGEAWAVLTDVGRAHPKFATASVIRGCRRIIVARRLRRVQARVVSAFYAGRLWAERMGFREEGTMLRAGPSGEDMTMYALLADLPERAVDSDGLTHVWRHGVEHLDVDGRLVPMISGGGGYGEIIFAVVAAVGTAVSAYSAYSQGQAQASAQRYNAKLAENQAAGARNAADVEASQRLEHYRRVQAQNRANVGAAGVTEAGSPLLVMADNAAQAEMDAQLVRYRGELGATTYQGEANLRRYGAGRAEAGGYLGAGSTLLSGAYDIGSRYYGGKKLAAISQAQNAPYMGGL
jgi:hypothetical protein